MSVVLKSRLLAIASALPARVKVAQHIAAERIALDAQMRVTVGRPPDPHPGRLRDSIHAEERAEGWYVLASARAGEDEQGAPYGHMLEFGTVDTAPQPFLVPAAEAIRGDYVVLVAGSLRNL